MPQNLDKFEQTVKNLIPCETFLQTLGRFLLYVVNNFYYQFAFPNAEEPHKKQKKKKQARYSLNTHAGTPWKNLYRYLAAFVVFRVLTLPSINDGLTHGCLIRFFG